MLLNVQYPFQCIRCTGDIIVASAGPKLYSFSASDGRKLYTWPESKTEAGATAEGNDRPPEKRRKLSPSGTAEDEHSDNPAVEKDNGSATTWSSIPILVTSRTGRHVVAVTGEDKHLRVFDINSEGVLSQLNARQVPKKPCMVAFSSDGNTIICADKAGDVYSIPLLGSDEDFLLASRPKKKSLAANPLVVHSKRNLESLRQQLIQTETGVGVSHQQSGPSIRRDILLGHVSMLTDLAIASLPSKTSSSGSHYYILTADRDEQIRVSRGAPQTHIAEAYCLGHESFISKMCVPATMQHLLVSGGGDDFLFVWHWRNGQLLQKIQIASETGKNETVVRGIWAASIENSASVAIFVALDGSNELLSFSLETSGKIAAQSPLLFSGNVLDLTFIDERSTFLVSIDSCHEPGSTKNWKNNFDDAQKLIEGYEVSINDGKLEFQPTGGQFVDKINAQGTEQVLASVEELAWSKTQKLLSETLYNLNNLRKREVYNRT